MLRISEVNPDDGAAVLKLEGRLIGPWVEELRNACRKWIAESKAFRLDLADVSYADREGVALLLSLRNQEIAFAGCSPFVQAELKMAGADPLKLPAQDA